MADDTPINEEQLKRMRDELNRLSRMVYYDQLTHVLNRRGFLEEAERIFHLVSYRNTTVERRTGFQIPFSVIFVDIDDFKAVNDTYGHAAGDEALKVVAHALKRGLREGDLFGRIGGEEFAIALIGAAAQCSNSIAEKLCATVASVKFVWNGVHIPLTASFGVAEYVSENTLSDLITKSDHAMYRAKKQGKNRVEPA